MALKIRLRKQGRTNRPFFRLVVTDSRSRRDGRYVESVGWYNPVEENDENKLFVKSDRVQHWLDNGAILTESVQNLVSKAAPDVVKKLREKRQAHFAKVASKRKARKKGE